MRVWDASKQLFGYYLHNYAAFRKIYGAYALVAVVAFWIFYASIVFIIGAEIGKLYTEKIAKLRKKKEIFLQ